MLGKGGRTLTRTALAAVFIVLTLLLTQLWLLLNSSVKFESESSLPKQYLPHTSEPEAPESSSLLLEESEVDEKEEEFELDSVMDTLVDWQFVDWASNGLTDIESRDWFESLRNGSISMKYVKDEFRTLMITESVSENARKNCASFIQIVDHKIYQHPQARNPILNLKNQWISSLAKLLRRGLEICNCSIPNVEIAIEPFDLPNVRCKKVPFLAYSATINKLTHFQSFIVPYFVVSEKSTENLIKENLKSSSVPWRQKRDSLFWRGSSTGIRNDKDLNRLREKTRFKLLKIANLENGSSRYDDVDVKLTKIYAETPKDLHAELRQYLSSFVDLTESLRENKFHVDVEGNSWSDRLKYLFTGNVVVLKQDYPYVDYLGVLFQPNIDYIPVKYDLSDLLYKFAMAKNDPSYQKIADSSFKKSVRVTSKDFASLYLIQLLKKISTVMDYEPILLPNSTLLEILR